MEPRAARWHAGNLEEDLKLAIITAHAGADSLEEAMASWGTVETRPPVFIMDGKNGMLQAYQAGFESLLPGRITFPNYDILAFLHDDVLVHDPDWVQRVLKEFEDPQVGLVGFGGATGHGDPNLYKIPYDYRQLGRSNFLSNMTDAEAHGKRFTTSCDVAVLDGFALIVRRSLLDRCNGWPLDTPIGYLCYDYWLCCVVRRLGYRIRLVGVSCTHLGGRTFVKMGIGQREDHWPHFLAAHRYIYDEFRDVLPFSV